MRSVSLQAWIGSLAAVTLLSAAPAAGAATPPAYLKCEAYVGEGQVLDGLCRVSTLSGNRVMVEAFSDETRSRSGLVFLFVPHGDRDTVLWNGEPNRRDPRQRLGVAQFFDTCWRSVAHSEIPFSVCLIVPTRFNHDAPLPF